MSCLRFIHALRIYLGDRRTHCLGAPYNEYLINEGGGYGSSPTLFAIIDGITKTRIAMH